MLRNIDVCDSLVLFGERKKIDSSAGKQTRDLSIKLWVLYQLSSQGIHVSPSKQLSHNIMTIWSWAPVALYMHQPPGGDFTCGRRVHLQLKGSSRLLGYVEKYRCLWQSGVVWREKIDSSARKWTRDLSIKLWVLYQLSYQGIHVSPSKQLSHNIMTIWSEVMKQNVTTSFPTP